jgi:hypothetical protein
MPHQIDEQTLKRIRFLIDVDENGTDAFKRPLLPFERPILPCDEQLASNIGEVFASDKLKQILRGLIKYSQWAGPGYQSGGSASPVIPIYKVFVGRYPYEEPELTSWIVENRVNEYEPFGTTHHEGARSLAEFLQKSQKSWQSFKKAEQLELKKSAKEHEIKLALAAIKATNNLPNAVRRGDTAAVESLLAKGADHKEAIKSAGSLMQLANSEGREAMVKFLKKHGID